MDTSFPKNFEVSTFILLAQTFFDFFYSIAKAKTSRKFNFEWGIPFVFLIILVFIIWIVTFFDFGFRAMIYLLQEAGFNKNVSSVIGITSYYLGYNFAKKLDRSKYGYSMGSGDFIGSLFARTAIAVLSCIFIGFLAIWLKNKV